MVLADGTTPQSMSMSPAIRWFRSLLEARYRLDEMFLTLTWAPAEHDGEIPDATK